MGQYLTRVPRMRGNRSEQFSMDHQGWGGRPGVYGQSIGPWGSLGRAGTGGLFLQARGRARGRQRTYTASPKGPNGTEIYLQVAVEGSGQMASMWEAMCRPLLPQLAQSFANELKEKKK